jgi:hypothetical protein
MLALLATTTLTGRNAMGAAGRWSWQWPHAKVLPEGDLQWAPQPFEFTPGNSICYIDYEGGDDSADGRSRSTAWKHHPWDGNAGGKAAAFSGAHTYVFKGGVVYRGALRGAESGMPDDPIRLTVNPNWGEGAAVVCGSEQIATAWSKVEPTDAPEGLPEPGKVWVTQLGAGPRPWTLWQIDGDEIVRLPLARTPNWRVVDPMDVMSEWWEWEWGNSGIAEEEIEGKSRLNYGKDPQHLDLPADAYEQAFMYTEWGPVMGTPAAREILRFDPETHTAYFGGFWGGPGQRIYGGNRYYLENSPYFLDEGGEWWFDEETRSLYLRLPDDGDPNDAHFEAGRIGTLIDMASGTENVEISGLTFRFTNVGAPNRRPFTPDINVACIRMHGSGGNLRVANCVFEHINTAVKLKAAGGQDLLEDVSITDNRIAYTDHGAIAVADGSRWGLREPPKGVLRGLEILRNSLFEIGRRPPRGENGHAVPVSFPETAHIAGNILDRCYGAGLFIFGGKPSGYLGDAPMSRILIHHNKVTNSLLRTNDWGGIETWQGGPHYVFNNISGNPWGYWNWQKRHFGFAYYMDGSFKNYQFNNIAWGTSSIKSPHGNTSAFQEIISYQNTVFNNSIFRFVVGTRRQAPQAGRDAYLANIWEEIGDWYFWHASPARSPDEANQADVGRVGESFAYETMSYARNIFAGAADHFGCFEANGMPHNSIESMRQALTERGALAPEVGRPVAVSPYRNAEAHDFRLNPASAAVDSGVRVFVPWGLYAMIGEWNFRPNQQDPAEIIDDHWYMKPYFAGRQTYYEMPMHRLHGVNISASDYADSPYEDWTQSVLTLNGRDQYARITQAEMNESVVYNQDRNTVPGEQLVTLDMDANNFLIEAIFRTDPGHTGGVLVSKMHATAGYALSINERGGASLTIRSAGVDDAGACGVTVNDGKWHHVIAEADRRDGRLRIYVDGRMTRRAPIARLDAAASLANRADFVVGRGSEGDYFAGAVDFVRVSRGTLADAFTEIDELYNWQFDGPQYRDFVGNEPVGKRDAGALELVPEE